MNSHNGKALQCIVDQFGVYAAHLIAMVGETTITSMDRARLQGYNQQWTQGKMLVECAMYVELLQMPSVLSQSLQKNDIDIMQGIKQVLKAASTLQSLAKKPLNCDLQPSLYCQGSLKKVVRKCTRDLFSPISQTARSLYALLKPW